MIEKIARAICEADGYSDPNAPFSGNALSGPRWEQYKTMAEAALDALLVPTDDMTAEGYAAGYEADTGVDEITEVLVEVTYTAMILAAKDGK